MSAKYEGKTAITFGVFDLLHFGHFELFRRIRELVGPTGKVYVMLQVDEMIAKYKPGCKAVYDFKTRKSMIDTLRTVTEAIPYDVVGIDAVKDLDFDVLVKGPEHNNERFQVLGAWCAEHGKTVVASERTACAEGIIHGETGWIAPDGDCQSYAEGIRHCLAHPVDRATVVAKTAEIFSSDKILKDVLDVYTQSLRRNR